MSAWHSPHFMNLTQPILPTIKAFNFVPDVSSAKGAAEDMVRLIDSQPKIGNNGSTDPTAKPNLFDIEKTHTKVKARMQDEELSVSAGGRIELQDVHFRYREYSVTLCCGLPSTHAR